MLIGYSLEAVSYTHLDVYKRQLCAHEGTLKEFKRQLKEYSLPWDITFSKAMGKTQNVTFMDKGIASPTTGP